MAAPTVLRTTTWTDFALRPNLSSAEGIIPTTGSVCDCPDIIISTDPIADPQQTLSSKDSWNSQGTRTVSEGVPTYIYVRSRNFRNGRETGEVSLYYTPAQLINWPSEWVNNDEYRLRPQGHGDVVHLTAHKHRDIAVGDKPFYWQAPPPSPNGHYCLFALVNTPHTQNPLPNHIPNGYQEMADLVHNNLNIGWRNTIEVESDVPTWAQPERIPLTFPSTCPAGERVAFMIIATSGTVGGAVALSSSDTHFDPIIDVHKTPIDDAARPITFITTPRPPVHSAILNLSFWKGSSNPGLNDSIEVVPVWIPPHDEAAAPYVERGIAQRIVDSNGSVHQGVAIGGMTYRFRPSH